MTASAFVAEPTLEPVACVPFDAQLLLPEEACQVRSYTADGTLARVSHLRWEQGREVFRRDELASGRWTEVTNGFDGVNPILWREVHSDGTWSERIQRWAGGIEIFHRTADSSGRWEELNRQLLGTKERLVRKDTSSGWWTETEWMYLPSGEPERKEERGSGMSTLVTRYFYDANGHLQRTENDYGVTTYTTDAQGRVVLADNGYTLRHYTYHPNGQVARDRTEDPTNDQSVTYEYDAQGRTTLYESCRLGDCNSEQTAYRPDGQVLTSEKYTSRRLEEHVTRRALQYDSEGRPVIDWNADEHIDYRPSEPIETRSRSTQRSTWLCGVNRRVMQETDSNEDGLVDSVRQLQRNANGRVVRELLSGGTPAPDDIVRIEYQYTCD
ncbi:hypothetical protein ACLESD_16515 [Pyxidicoccus sp. 3LFB2]